MMTEINQPHETPKRQPEINLYSEEHERNLKTNDIETHPNQTGGVRFDDILNF